MGPYVNNKNLSIGRNQLQPNNNNNLVANFFPKRKVPRPISGDVYHGNEAKEKNLAGIKHVIEELYKICKNSNPKISLPESVKFSGKQCQAYSQLAFYLAYQEPDLFANAVGTLKFPFPQDDGSTTYYTLDQTIDFGGGVKAFGFLGQSPQDSPILLFHGTPMKTCSSGMGRAVIADIDPFGVGFVHYQLNKKAVEKWLQKATKRSKTKARVCGHSLGGCFATFSGVEFPAYVQQVIAFNAPSVDKRTYSKYNAMKDKGKLKITTFNAQEDRFSDYGNGFRVGNLVKGKAPEDSKYKGSHTTSLFIKESAAKWTVADTDEINKQAGSCFSTAFNYVIGGAKCFLAIPLISTIGVKKLLFGCRSWNVYKNGLPGVFERAGPLLRSLLDLFFQEASFDKLSEISKNKIKHFISKKSPKECIDAAKADLKKSRPELTLQEFSVIYLLATLQQDKASSSIRTVPLKVKLMNEVVQCTFQGSELQQNVQQFYKQLNENYGNQLNYLYNEDNFLKDLKVYLEFNVSGQKKKTLNEKMNKCRERLNVLKKFKVFLGNEVWFAPSKLEEEIVNWKF